MQLAKNDMKEYVYSGLSRCMSSAIHFGMNVNGGNYSCTQAFQLPRCHYWAAQDQISATNNPLQLVHLNFHIDPPSSHWNDKINLD